MTLAFIDNLVTAVLWTKESKLSDNEITVGH